ncbi:MAG TPA: hypothetical protein GX697_02860 [Firmicutes bacterium]|nr:hypothetical protein [Bacillota bacterium]
MKGTQEVKYLKPETLDEAIDLLGHYPQAELLAGGTDLLVAYKKGRCFPEQIVDISSIPELKGISLEGEKVRIGSMTTFTELVACELINEKIKALAEAAASVGSPQIRNRGTIGGNIVSASPAADTVTPLIALDAGVTLTGPGGSRELALCDFLLGAGRVNIYPGEILTSVTFRLPADFINTFVKLGRRNAMTISRINLALFVQLDNLTFRDARIAAGAVSPNPCRLKAVEECLIGRTVSKEVLTEAVNVLAASVCDKIGDRPSAPYKKVAVKGIAWEGFEKLFHQYF